MRRYQRLGGKVASEYNILLKKLAGGYGLPVDLGLSEHNSSPVPANRYLFIRAWGYGFWSDVHHVLGQLLVAELTHRTPVVWWGKNSLFNDLGSVNAFDFYFEKIGPTLSSELLKNLSIWPCKWSAENLFGEAIQTWSGKESRLAAPYFFARGRMLW